MALYRDKVLPWLIDRMLRGDDVDAQRRLAMAGLSGTVVEIGFGSGRNVALYPAEVGRVFAVEPSPGARRLAAPRIARSPVPVDLVGLDGEQVPLDDGVADAVLTTWTLCTIPDAGRALAEMRRILRPGGRLHFLEHGRHPAPDVARWQRRLTPIQQRLVGGCRLDRPIDQLITDAGFEVGTVAHDVLHGSKIFGYLYRGVATAPTGR